MTITPEQEMKLAKFPAMLRFLIETELASGNTIIEVGHSFPAPSAGAYIKLANKVSTRARADGDGLTIKDGARFCNSHREGGTTIYCIGERFVRSDYTISMFVSIYDIASNLRVDQTGIRIVFGDLAHTDGRLDDVRDVICGRSPRFPCVGKCNRELYEDSECE